MQEVFEMTILGQMLEARGIEKGIEKGEKQFAILTGHLIEDSRMEDLKTAAKDEGFREKLYIEYGIKARN